MPFSWLTSSNAMVPIGGSWLTNCAYPTWCMCTPTPSNPISREQYRSQAVRDVPACNSSTCAGGAGWWDNLFCFLLNSGLSVCPVCLCFVPALLYLVCLTSFALCPAGWLRLRWVLLVHALLLLLLLLLSVSVLRCVAFSQSLFLCLFGRRSISGTCFCLAVSDDTTSEYVFSICIFALS